LRYYKYIIAVQLFVGSIWFLYYSVYWVGMLLMSLFTVMLIPIVFKLLKKKMNGLEAGCLIFAVLFIVLSALVISYFCSALKPVKTKKDIATKDLSVYVFEQNLLNLVEPCFTAYDKAFSKSLKYQEDQCALIKAAQSVCNSAQRDIGKIESSKSPDPEITGLFNEAKTDAANSLQNWEKLFSMYNNLCISQTPLNETEVKLQLISAAKNMYMLDVKIKKAKSKVMQ